MNVLITHPEMKVSVVPSEDNFSWLGSPKKDVAVQLRAPVLVLCSKKEFKGKTNSKQESTRFIKVKSTFSRGECRGGSIV